MHLGFGASVDLIKEILHVYLERAFELTPLAMAETVTILSTIEAHSRAVRCTYRNGDPKNRLKLSLW